MDELIILLIKGIIRLLSGPPQGGQQRRPNGPPPPPPMSVPPQFQPPQFQPPQFQLPQLQPPQFQKRPGNVATARRPGVVTPRRPGVVTDRRPAAPPPRRPGRRPGSAMVAVAAPILTPTGADLERDVPLLKATAASNIRANRGSVADKADARAAAASPTDIRRWLTPVALRQQVALAEILGKPLALRDDR